MINDTAYHGEFFASPLADAMVKVTGYFMVIFTYTEYNAEFIQDRSSSFFQRKSWNCQIQSQAPSWHTAYTEGSPFSAKNHSLGFLLPSGKKRGDDLCLVSATARDVLTSLWVSLYPVLATPHCSYRARLTMSEQDKMGSGSLLKSP